jgi:hypothetical protein
MDALQKLQHINDLRTLTRAIKSKMEKDKLTEDQIMDVLDQKMKDSTEWAESLSTQTAQIEYYRTEAPEQFEQIKNNPSMPGVAEKFVAGIVFKKFVEASKDLISYLDYSDLTMEVYIRAVGLA